MKSSTYPHFRFIFVVAFAALLASCGGGEATSETPPEGTEKIAEAAAKEIGGELKVHLVAQVESLNPQIHTGADAGHIIKLVYQALIDIDFETLEISPILAEKRATLEEQPDGTLHITYRIRDEATWANGDPITADDAEFALKISMNAHIDNGNHRNYYEFISDFIKYEDDPKKLTIVSNQKYLLAEAAAGDFYFVPRDTYDPKGLLSEFTIKQMQENWDEIADDPRLIEFGEWFNQKRFQTDPASMKGSGPYEVSEFVTGQRVVLQRKAEWWGDNVKNKSHFFEAWPQIINYQVVKDYATAEVALKGQKLDLMKSIPPDVFLRLRESEQMKKHYDFHTPSMINYSYIGLNTRDVRLSDKAVRHALAHVTNVSQMIDVVLNGLGEQLIGPVHPTNRYYNKDIEPYAYDIERAKTLLAEAGWADSDGDGILDKTIDGTLQELDFNYIFNPNPVREACGQLFAAEARKIGIKINLEVQEFPVYVGNLKSHNFDLFFGKWVQTPLPRDHKQIYHTESYADGHNFVGFGTEESDALIDEIRGELDEDKRGKLNLRFQEICHEESAYIFLFSESNNIIAAKKLDHLIVSEFRVGYWEPSAVIGQN